MADMFNGCSSLVYINFTNFDTSNAQRMHWMFSGCTSLLSLDLSNFNTSLVQNMEGMFYNCKNIQYINLKNFEQNEGLKFPKIFNEIPKNVIVCINEQKAPDLFKLIKELNCSNVYCLDNWYNQQKKLIKDKKECIDNCNINHNYKYELNNKCYSSCTYGIFYDKKNELERCKSENEKCSIFSDLNPIKHLCISCNESFYPKENDPTNLGPYINCYKDPPGYYLDKSDINNSIYKLCYERCKTCRIKGDEKNNNCLECSIEYSFAIPNNNNYLNCYKNCSYYYYFDNEGQYTCTSNTSCPLEYSKLNNRQCIKNCSLNDINKYEFRGKCYAKCPKESEESKTKENFCEAKCDEEKPFVIISTQVCVDFCDVASLETKKCEMKFKFIEEEENEEENDTSTYEDKEKKKEEVKKQKEIKAQDKFLDNMEKAITSGNFDTTSIKNGTNIVIKNNKVTVTLDTLDNQKNDEKDNTTKVNLGKCENILRNAYNIDDNQKIIMKKIDVIQEGLNIPKVEIDVYCYLNSSNLEKLNLSLCSKTKMDISVPIVLTESIDKLNSKSDYYNDICYTSTSNRGTDIILEDRQKEFKKSNKTICQDGCDFSDYNYNIQKAKCSCEIKESSFSSALMNVNKTKLFENFIDFDNIANTKILKCVHVLFSKLGFKKNIGAYTIIPIIIIHIISFFLFYYEKINVIKDIIKDIIFGIKNWKLVKAKKEEEQRKAKLEKERIKKDKDKKDKKEKEDEINFRANNKGNKKGNKKNSKNKSIKIIKDNKEDEKDYKIVPPVYEYYSKYIQNKNNNPPKKNNNKKNNNNNASEIVNINNQIKKEETIKKAQEIMAETAQELNDLPYKLALKYDKRNYCQYYMSLIRTKHNLIFSFYYTADYNSRIIKVDLFFISFVIYYTVNALFFNDETMHQIYEDEGEYHFIYQLPQIIYSSMISSVLNIFLKLLALSEKDILKLKKNKNDKNLEERNKELNSKLRIKFILYFIISTIFVLLFWYYISMFCAIYKNTQTHLIKDTLVSFALSLLYPFIIYLFPGLLRIPALSNKKNQRNYLYQVSKLLQMI